MLDEHNFEATDDAYINDSGTYYVWGLVTGLDSRHWIIDRSTAGVIELESITYPDRYSDVIPETQRFTFESRQFASIADCFEYISINYVNSYILTTCHGNPLTQERLSERSRLVDTTRYKRVTREV